MALNTVWRFLTFAALLCALLLSASVSAASSLLSYERYRVFELALHADIVVTGEIGAVQQETFDLRVEQRIVGGAEEPSIRVKQFDNWTCASRWTEYAAGQRVLLFLSNPKDGVCSILGGGGEGEMPLHGTDVIVRGYRVRGFDHGHTPIGSESVSGAVIALDEITNAVRGLRATLRLEEKPDAQGFIRDRVSLREAIGEFESFARTSRTARHMFGEAISNRSWTGPPAPPGDQPNSKDLRWLRSSPDAKHSSDDAISNASGLTFTGDFNGDGIDDLAAVTPFGNDLGSDDPVLRVLCLDSHGAVASQLRIDPAGAGPNFYMDAGHYPAAAIASLGDLDGDGIAELCLGSAYWRGDKGRRGTAWTLFPRRDGTLKRFVEISAAPQLSAAGVEDGVGFGNCLATLGDLDGDGSVELAIGQDPLFDYGTEHGRSVYITSIARDGSVAKALRIDGRHEGLSETGNWLGDSLARVGDVNGDGITDLAVGVPDDTDGGEVRGAVWILFLAKDGSVLEKHKISGWEGDFNGALVDWSCFGRTLAGPGDIDGDRVPDLLVGSNSGIWTLFLTRSAKVRAHRKLESGSTGKEYFGFTLTVQTHAAENSSATVICGGARGVEARVLWTLTLDKSGALRPR